MAIFAADQLLATLTSTISPEQLKSTLALVQTVCLKAAADAAGARAKALASVAPEVKTTQEGSAPTSAATCARAASTRVAARRPGGWFDPGLPSGSASSCAISAATVGSTGVVAAWSR